MISRRNLIRTAAGSVVLSSGLARANSFFTPPPNDPDYAAEWHLTKMQVPAAWAISQGDCATVIAIVDSGVTLPIDYPVCAQTGTNIVAGNTSTVDWSGGSGHGSMVTSISMGTTNNSAGVAAVSPNATLLPIVVLNSAGSGTSNQCSFGIQTAADMGAHIIQCSWNFPTGDFLTNAACDYAWGKGAIVVCGGGDGGGSHPAASPGSAANVLCVGWTDSSDVISPTCFTNYPNCCAPGVAVEVIDKNGASGTISGGSFSGPMVSGILALMRTANPRYILRNDELYNLFIKNGLDAIAGKAGYPTLDAAYGYGRANALKAVTAAYGYVRPFFVRAAPFGGL